MNDESTKPEIFYNVACLPVFNKLVPFFQTTNHYFTDCSMIF